MWNDYRVRFAKMIETAAADAEQRMRTLAAAGRIETLYLYHEPANNGHDGALRMFADSDDVPECFELTTGEGLRCHVPYAHYQTWIRERASRAPVLGPDPR